MEKLDKIGGVLELALRPVGAGDGDEHRLAHKRWKVLILDDNEIALAMMESVLQGCRLRDKDRNKH